MTSREAGAMNDKNQTENKHTLKFGFANSSKETKITVFKGVNQKINLK